MSPSTPRKSEEIPPKLKGLLRLQDNEASFRDLAEFIPQIVWTSMPDGTRDYYNHRWYDYTGLTPDSIRDPESWVRALHPDDQESTVAEWKNAIATGEDYQIQTRFRNAAGEYRWHLGRAVSVRDAEGKIVKWFGTNTDIHDQKLAEERIRYQAYHDVLTNLPNRILIEEKLERAMREADENKSQCAVLFIDLDRFKVINDSLGHRIGDTLLKEVAERLRHCTLRKDDLVGRLGGDEFMILLTRLASDRDAVRIARRVSTLLESPIKVDSHSLHVDASIGIAFYPSDGKDVHAIFKNADLALYRAKEYGRNRYQMYDETMNQQATKRLGLETDLRAATRNRELCLFYQPILDLEKNQVVELEALARWYHPRFGVLLPSEFIPVAEETGLIVPIGKWILQTACREFKSWQSSGLSVPRLSINLSPLQFSDAHLTNHIEGALKENHLRPDCLNIEITESTAMENIDRTIHKLKALKTMGINITIDDFGIGYSSLNYLRRFPLDKLKIDKSFVKHAVIEEQDATLIKTIISIGHTLNLKVVAEGVENSKQAALMSALGCDKIQGYFVSEPLNAEDMAVWLRKRQNELF